MQLVTIKMLEVLSRASFTIGAIYLLPTNQAGQFGLTSTLIGLFAFAFGWERHLDLQRRLAGSDAALFDQAVRQLLPFWGLNYVLMAPLLVLLLTYLATASLALAGLAVVIAIGEQVANSTYNLSVVERRYVPLVLIVAIRSILLVVTLVAILNFSPHMLRVDVILAIWAIGAALSVLALAIGWHLIQCSQSTPSEKWNSESSAFHSSLFGQHRASWTHFVTGTVAVLVLQIDRLIVGTLLPHDQVGVYFRHVVAVSFAYQFFNIMSFNRNISLIIQYSRSDSIRHATRIIRRELKFVFVSVLACFASMILFDFLTLDALSERLQISLSLIALMLVGALAKIAADFIGILLNARLLEAQVLKNQIVSFGVGLVLLIIMTKISGLFGTAGAVVIANSLYLGLNFAAVRKLVEGSPC